MTRLLFFVCFIFYSSVFFAQEVLLPADVERAIIDRINSGLHQSIVVGIIDKDGPHYYAFGKRKSGGKKVNEHSIYEIGSISKVFTGILLADQVVKGKLNTNDPIENLLPNHIKAPTYEGQSITLGHLSDHTSSLPRMPDNFNPANPLNPYQDYTTERMYDFLSNYHLSKPIGSEYEYSNLGVGLLGHLLSIHHGVGYEQLLKSTITKPLGMLETGVTLSKKMKKNLAYGHHEGEQVPNWDLPTFAGAGGIRSSAHDMLIFLKANLHFSETPLSPAILLTQMPRHDKADGARVGLGWHILKGSNGDIHLHSGGTGGYTSFAGIEKSTGRGVVVLTNSDVSVEDLGLHLLDPKIPLQNMVPHIATVLRKEIEEKGIATLNTIFDQYKKDFPSKYDYSETGINTLGYYFLNRRKYAEAKAVFLLNIREYPNSSNVYDSYGEALMENGEKDEAIVNYQKSLVLNPGNLNAVEMLAKLGVTASLPEKQVDPDILKSYAGTYQLFDGFDIIITVSDNHLFAQATGQLAYEIFAKSDTEFYYKVVDAQITFHPNDKGITNSLTLFQNGREVMGKKK